MHEKEFKSYIQKRLSQGHHWFTNVHAAQMLGITLRKLKLLAKDPLFANDVFHMGKGFYVILNLVEYPHGKLKPELFLDAYMNHTGMPYYVSTLSAAFAHGVSDQKPERLQLITAATIYQSKLDEFNIDAHSLVKRFKFTRYQRMDSLQVATREQTVIDLVQFYQDCGGWGNISKILHKLIPLCNLGNLELVISKARLTDVQLLGYICECLSDKEGDTFTQASEISLRILEGSAYTDIPLSPNLPKTGEKDRKWKLFINEGAF